jgi:hypothetical protein
MLLLGRRGVSPLHAHRPRKLVRRGARRAGKKPGGEGGQKLSMTARLSEATRRAGELDRGPGGQGGHAAGKREALKMDIVIKKRVRTDSASHSGGRGRGPG